MPEESKTPHERLAATIRTPDSEFKPADIPEDTHAQGCPTKKLGALMSVRQPAPAAH